MDKMQDFRRAMSLAILSLAGTVVGAHAALAQSAIRADFNSDGFSDLAIGVIAEEVGSVEVAGAVNVLYGSAGGLSAEGNQFWHQDRSGINDTVEHGDLFGSSLSAGDFDGDGFADLAIGVSNEDLGSAVGAGAVNILYGSASGLSAAANQFWHQNSGGIKDAGENGDALGLSLAAGDFDGDGFVDLAIGVPRESVGFVAEAGAVNVLYGSATGLSAAGNQFWAKDGSRRFGSALDAGDFNGDGLADLAVGMPEGDVGPVGGAGAVNVIYGSAAGLSAAGNQFWHQDRGGIADAAEESDFFGEALGVGDFNGDGFADLAIGVRNEDFGSAGAFAGAVNVIYGSASGLSAAGNQFWHQDRGGINDTAENGDAFGFSLVAGDLNGDGFGDLAVGVPFEGVGATDAAGAVNVLYGSAGGLSAAGNQFWSQDSPGIVDAAEFTDFFGSALGTGDFDGDGFADLAVGFAEDVGTVPAAGAVSVLYGSPTGVSPAGNQLWHQDSAGIVDVAEPFDSFGNALTR